MKMLLTLMSLLLLSSLPAFAQNEKTETQFDNEKLEAGAVDCEQCKKNAWSKRRTDPNASQIAAQILDQKKSPDFDSPATAK